jgi:dsRNA-specific ribonuclease
LDYSKCDTFKKKEYIGDALLHLILCLEIVPKVKSRAEGRLMISRLSSTEHLVGIAKRLGIEQHPDDPSSFSPTKPDKPLANAIELCIYEIFEREGLESAREFVIRNIIRSGNGENDYKKGDDGLLISNTTKIS